MILNGTYTLEAVGEVRQLSPTTTLMSVKFKTIDEIAYMYGNYADTLSFLDKEVIVEFREEFLDGQARTVITNITVVNKVITLDRTEGLKLYTDFEFNTGSNVIFDNIAEGELIEKAIVYCKTVEQEASAKASWVKLTVVDKLRRIGYIRVFDADHSSKIFEGKYVKCAMRKTKFGFNATDVYLQSDINISINPKVAIAKQYVMATVVEDSVLSGFVTKFDLINKIETYNYEEGEETGMLLVRLAIELSMINETVNLSDKIDIELLKRLAVASKAYVISSPETSTYSRELQSLIVVTAYPDIARDRKVLCCFDNESGSPYKLIEREYYKHIQAMAKTLIAIDGPEGYMSTLEGVLKNK